MRKWWFLLVLVLCTLKVKSQNNFGVEISGGVSRSFYLYPLSFPSYTIGLLYQKQIWTNKVEKILNLSTGLKFCRVQGIYNENKTLENWGNNSEPFNDFYFYPHNRIGIPLIINYTTSLRNSPIAISTGINYYNSFKVINNIVKELSEYQLLRKQNVSTLVEVGLPLSTKKFCHTVSIGYEKDILSFNKKGHRGYQNYAYVKYCITK